MTMCPEKGLQGRESDVLVGSPKEEDSAKGSLGGETYSVRLAASLTQRRDRVNSLLLMTQIRPDRGSAECGVMGVQE